MKSIEVPELYKGVNIWIFGIEIYIKTSAIFWVVSGSGWVFAFK